MTGDVRMLKGKLGVVVVADDDSRVLFLERSLLEQEGYRVIAARDGVEALDAIVAQGPDLILLDLYMPRMDGITVCQRVRESSQTPIILITGKGSEEDKLRGFDAGADDYITKPLSPGDFLARIKAVLRRAGTHESQQEAFRFGELVVDFRQNRVTVAGREILLTGTEYRLMACLAQNAGAILTPDQLLERVWGEEYVGEEHLLRVTLARLRQKLGDDARQPTFIVTRPGIGYFLACQTLPATAHGS